MKRVLSMVLLAASCLVLLVSLFFCIYSIYDINRALDELANDPSASGIDYFGVGWGYGISLFAVSTVGFILSGISKKRQQHRTLQYIASAVIVVFSLLAVASIFLFFR